MPKSTIAGIFGSFDTRLKRIEEQIGSATDKILQFMSLNDEVGATDYIKIYKKTINTTFIIGTSEIGDVDIGDRRGGTTLVYEGDG